MLNHLKFKRIDTCMITLNVWREYCASAGMFGQYKAHGVTNDSRGQ